jgi:hypothetical protein
LATYGGTLDVPGWRRELRPDEEQAIKESAARANKGKRRR